MATGSESLGGSSKLTDAEDAGACLMAKQGRWSLAPAFDMTYSYNPAGLWTATHQITMNGKRDGFTLADFEVCAKSAQMKDGCAAAILDEVRAAAVAWPACAGAARVDAVRREQMRRTHRLSFAVR